MLRFNVSMLEIKRSCLAKALVFLGVDPGERARGNQLPAYCPLQHLLGVDKDALRDTRPQRRLLLQQIEPLMQGYLLSRQLSDQREHV